MRQALSHDQKAQGCRPGVSNCVGKAAFPIADEVARTDLGAVVSDFGSSSPVQYEDGLVLVVENSELPKPRGKPLGQIAVPGAKSLNDIAVARDGTVYVSESAADGPPAVLRVKADGTVAPLASGKDMVGIANGLLVRGEAVLVADGDLEGRLARRRARLPETGDRQQARPRRL